MKIDLHVHKVTGDETFPTPWRYWCSVDTPYGNHTGEGLARTEQECVEFATQRFTQWVLDQKVARETKKVIPVQVDVEAILGIE